MANENKDVIRVFDLENNFVGERLKRGMFGATADTNKFVERDLSTGTYYFTDNNLNQVLLDDEKIITGNKTISGNLTTSGARVLTPRVPPDPTPDDSILVIGDEPVIRIKANGSLGTFFTVGFSAGLYDNQVIEIWIDFFCSLEIDPAVSLSAPIFFTVGSKMLMGVGEYARFRWAVGGTPSGDGWFEIGHNTTQP